MSVVMIIELSVRPGSSGDVLALLSPEQTRAFEGNEGVEVTIDANDANRVVLLAHWTSSEASNAYLASRESEGQERLFELLDGGRDGFKVRTLDVVERPRRRQSKTRDEGLEDLEEWARRWLTLRAEIRALNESGLSNEHLGPVIRMHNEELDSIMAALDEGGGA